MNKRVASPVIRPTKKFKFGEALAGVYPILDLIFDYLSAEDLKLCAEVSQSWNSAAQNVLKSRRAIGWFFCYENYKETKSSEVVVRSPNLNYVNAEIGIIFYDNSKLPSKLVPKPCDGLRKNKTEITKMVSYYLNGQPLPKHVNFSMFLVCKTSSYFVKVQTLEEMKLDGSIFDGVLIPKIPSVRTVMFECNPKQKKQLEKNISLHIKPHEQTKCLLIFCWSKIYTLLNNLFDHLIPKSSLVVVGGGLLPKDLGKYHDGKINPKPNHRVVCIAFLKDINSNLNNFNAYSCIWQTAISERDSTLKLVNFKKSINLKHHGLGFFICADDCQFLGEQLLRAFEREFPNLPLVNLCADEAFGWECYPNANVTDKDGNKQYPPVEKEYSLVFVIITWD